MNQHQQHLTHLLVVQVCLHRVCNRLAVQFVHHWQPIHDDRCLQWTLKLKWITSNCKAGGIRKQRCPQSCFLQYVFTSKNFMEMGSEFQSVWSTFMEFLVDCCDLPTHSPGLHNWSGYNLPIGPVPVKSLQWRHNERDGVSNNKSSDCLLHRLFKAQIKENIKVPRYCPLWGEFSGDRWIPHTNGQ